MARITISGTGTDENKNNSSTGGNTGTGSSSGTAAAGQGTSSGTAGNPQAGNAATSAGRVEQNTFYPTSGKVNQNQQAAETSLFELRSRYYEQAREQYENEVKKLREERDAALRENWILQQRAEAALPEEMAAMGINGGASETSLAALKAQYQGNRNDIRAGYMDNLGELSREQQNKAAEVQRGYDEKWLEYLLSLAKMEEQDKYD